MKVTIEARPGEAAEKARDLLKAIAQELAPASLEARLVLDALEDSAPVAVTMRDPGLERLRAKMTRVVEEELRDLERLVLEDEAAE